MKKNITFLSFIVCLAACSSRPKATTTEHRGDPGQSIAYRGFVDQRTRELQEMGGPFNNPATARQKAEDEANSRFGGNPGDSVTTTWSSDKTNTQEEFTDKLDDMAREKKSR